MKDELSAQQAEAVLQALDETLAKGPWEESNFLRVIGKNLREIREKFAHHLDSSQDKVKMAAHLANRIALRSGQQEIFIGLYSADGNNIYSWERIVANLPRQMISRPIYAEEKDIKEIIKTKENKVNEAYVSIYVNQNDILPLAPDKIPRDKLGKPLLSLKDKSLNLDNINRFIHISGIYKYAGGRLVKSTGQEID
ncbi:MULTISPECIES: Dot/Icm secretion system protein IcmQ [Legionella]|uniref:Dot/Icm secretion system protein IcmQ n=1 Tax=Legionella septentrionalis TaxID=2498109 RepID=A0A3S0V5B8_9GAMM|nr:MULTISPECIES: Dot/Icm secretion system protein IcmQ [Legionella]MCP0913198.1 Dot/Icm secretion system protein IcmQ [Legionella sp. 27cVA30]RUQ88043.1 Dot/Icm secretion system protein IcmQ [Legionella septentrionalis]RUR02422.1 Dot/Icm secretion system protein IcmQ [Legionella septentrionalis]RUR10366.1 Dot/Icm secretion system protein IcmQ [Legionella septentrionalis]RUR17080.1 Dot/Icm secretion system protein IcmQ [Legionella septentrionalis]